MKFSVPLENPAKIVVIGGGPSGSFFSILMLRKAKQANKKISIVIIEKKKELQFYQNLRMFSFREGCNYCAGGISPRLADIFEDLKIVIPFELLQSTVESLTVHGEWKNIEMTIPHGRKMFSVFRGSRPQNRADRHINFDAYLLAKAADEGAEIITGEVENVGYLHNGKPQIKYKVQKNGEPILHDINAEFVVFATGINNTFDKSIQDDRIVSSFKNLHSNFCPPKVRKALICELGIENKYLRSLKGEIHFVEFGSRNLKIEMSSLIPKLGCITIVILGKSVDNASPHENLQVMRAFLELPHIRRLLPKGLNSIPVCICNPRMVVKGASNPYGERMAIIGDLATSRLYKDGIYSGFITAISLVNTILNYGIDKNSLKSGYIPIIKRFSHDNYFGKAVFFLNRITFGTPFLSRIVYQAVLTERRKKQKSKRKLDTVLWRIASGDDEYKHIFISMFHPYTVSAIIIGGVLVTLRNTITEKIFNLKWLGFGRFPTGIYKELFEEKRNEIINALRFPQLEKSAEFESMYSIKIKAEKHLIFSQLGKFGDQDRKYFKPRFIQVHRIHGLPNQTGSIIQYKTFVSLFNFSIELEYMIDRQYLVYKVRDGFAKGGVVIFQLEEISEAVCILSIYVGFNFPDGKDLLSQLFWIIFKFLFPGFVHDVIWNHSLCKLKDIVEFDS